MCRFTDGGNKPILERHKTFLTVRFDPRAPDLKCQRNNTFSSRLHKHGRCWDYWHRAPCCARTIKKEEPVISDKKNILARRTARRSKQIHSPCSFQTLFHSSKRNHHLSNYWCALGTDRVGDDRQWSLPLVIQIGKNQGSYNLFHSPSDSHFFLCNFSQANNSLIAWPVCFPGVVDFTQPCTGVTARFLFLECGLKGKFLNLNARPAFVCGLFVGDTFFFCGGEAAGSFFVLSQRVQCPCSGSLLVRTPRTPKPRSGYAQQHFDQQQRVSRKWATELTLFVDRKSNLLNARAVPDYEVLIKDSQN